MKKFGRQSTTRPVAQKHDCSEVLCLAINQLNNVRAVLSGLGIRYRDLQREPRGVGISVVWKHAGYLVLSVAGADDDLLSITAGLLKDVRHDRSRILEICNVLTRDNAALPVYLNDETGGWDIHVQQRLRIDLLRAETDFFRACLESLPVAAIEMRSKFQESGIKGQSYSLNGEDAQHLLLRSLA